MAFYRAQFKTLFSRLEGTRKFIQVISGPRQVGKTTLALQVVGKLKVPVHFSSADESTDMRAVWIDQQWEAARVLASGAKSRSALLVVDEIQKIHQWSQAVKKNWDSDTRNKTKIKVVLLGSSQLLIQKGLTESLAGRFELIRLPHWSYNEMKTAFGFTPAQYVWYGGYPGAASLRKDPLRWKDYVLHSLIETTLSKDILMLNRVDKPALLRNLFEIGCSYSGQVVSYTKILGRLLDAGNTTTLAHYLDLLDGAGLLCGLEKYSLRKISSRSSIPKFQVKDTSLISVYSKMNFKEAQKNTIEWGRMVESAIGAHLVNHASEGGYEVFYWRERNDEIDFVISKNKKIIAIEVKTNAKDKISGANAFQQLFSPYRILLVGEKGIPWQKFLETNPSSLFPG